MSAGPDGVAAGPDTRRRELEASLADVRSQIASACAQAGRNSAEVTLIAVTKTFPLTDARHLYALGVGDLGENRDQEAKVKAAQLPEARWHYVGQLQTNKARSVVGYASAVHSVDRTSLADALEQAAIRTDRSEELDVFLQLSLDGDTARGGVAADALGALADQVAGSSRLRLRGVMAVAPLGVEPGRAFEEVAAASQRLRVDHPGASAISAGMSGDFAAAIAAGATHLRIGSALLGPREQVVG